MTIPVRAIQKTDVPEACRILNEIIAAGGTTAFETPFTDDVFAQCYLTGADIICCHVALDETGQVAGFQWLGRNDELPADCADVATFARRRPLLKGTGRALFPVTVKSARKLGFASINATIRADNVPGLSYYAKMGFVDHNVKQDVPLSDGTLVSRISKRYDVMQDPVRRS